MNERGEVSGRMFWNVFRVFRLLVLYGVIAPCSQSVLDRDQRNSDLLPVLYLSQNVFTAVTRQCSLRGQSVNQCQRDRTEQSRETFAVALNCIIRIFCQRMLLTVKPQNVSDKSYKQRLGRTAPGTVGLGQPFPEIH